MKANSPTVKTILALFAATAIAACADTLQGYVDIDSGQREIVLSGSNPRTVEFTASGEWYARINYAPGDTIKWLNVTPLTGEAGTHSLTITAKTPNYTGRDRTADVEIKLPANNGGVIKVIQPAVDKPRFLQSLRRAMSGAILSGPSDIEFEYNEKTETVSAFITGTGNTATRYERAGSGVDVIQPDGSSGQIPMKFTGERVLSTENMEWEFRDVYSGILLDRSSVRFEFSYDNSEDKLLQKITRHETVSVRDGETLTIPLTITETYEYKYTTIRIDSLIHIATYSDASTEPTTFVDTVKYGLKYAESYENIEDNNMTADVWELLVFPQLQGVPFYSLTGYRLLGLMGNMQPNLPEQMTVESRIHSPEGLAEEWALRYLYTYRRNAAKEITNSYSDIEYRSGTARGTVDFTYSDTIPVGGTEEQNEE